MKNITLSKKFSKAFGVLAAAMVFASFAPQASAGPGPQQVFHPVTSMKMAASIPVGGMIAISCGKCNGVAMMAVDKDRSYMTGFKCPSCGRKFHVVSPGGGGKGTDIYVLEDADKHAAHLSASGKM